MKLNLRFNRFADTEKNRQLVNQELATLENSTVPIRQADATVEHPEQDVSITMRVKLDIPGSPVVAEARDYTLRAVLKKAMHLLKRKLARRGQHQAITRYDTRRRSLPSPARA